MAKFRQKVKGLTLTFWRFWTIFGTFFKVNFLEKYTSNEALNQDFLRLVQGLIGPIFLEKIDFEKSLKNFPKFSKK